MAYGIFSMNLIRIICLTGGASLFAVAGALAWRARRKEDPEQEERLRRERINSVGRITDGTVLEVQEMDRGAGQAQVVVYSYDVRGVQYQCAQDVTPLHLALNRASCCTGDANIKYDPRHPGDSIVAAESWCGLRISMSAPEPASAD